MSWIEKLNTTYKNCKSEIGKGIEQNEKVLLPICHTTQIAHIRVTINEGSDFLRASLISKEKQNVITPCTEASGGRSGIKPVNHPLFDKLQYLSNDFKKYGGIYTKGYEDAFSKDAINFFTSKTNPHNSYMEQLEKFAKSDYSTKKIRSVYAYLSKETIISDLIKSKILHISDDTGILLNTRNYELEKGGFDIFSLLAGGYKSDGTRKPWQANAFVVFSVDKCDDSISDLDKNRTVWNGWINYYSSTKNKKGICLISGKETFLSGQHPSKIRSTYDKAKFLSSNDSSGFTYRGRFQNAEQACSIGYEVSQRAHNTLRWLISKQGYCDGELAVVAWGTNNEPTPNICYDTYRIGNFGNDPYYEEEDENIVDTEERSANFIVKQLAYYSEKLGPTAHVNVMAIKSPTKETSRLSVLYYRELTGSDFLKRIEDWHTGCAWLQKYSNDKVFYGTPSPEDIAVAAYGENLDDKLKHSTVERLLPSIIDNSPIPKDIVISTVRRASNRNNIKHWGWEKTLGIACALFRYCKKEEGYTMALEEERTSRDYLYGRLLAVADSLEGFALSHTEKGRPTNAARMMQRFAQHPCSTWRTIELALSSYKARLGHKGIKYERVIDEIMNNFDADDFRNDRSLSGEFLLGYHTQRSELMKSNKKNK